jgi:exosortase
MGSDQFNGSRMRWRSSHCAMAVVLVGLALLVTGDAWADALRLSLKDEEVQYVLVAPLVVAWLVWVRRWRLATCQAGYNWLGLPFIGLGWAGWAYGYRMSVPTLWHGGPILILIGLVICVTGIDVVGKFIPAFVALLFLIPITPTRRHILAAPMEHLAASWTAVTCELFGLHVVRYGNLLSANGVKVEVAEACNGMRQMVTFWLVCYVLAFGSPFRWYVRLLVLVSVPIVAILSNVVRLVPTVWVYSFGDGEAAQRFHDIAGWAMLLVAFGFIYGMLGLLRWTTVSLQRFPSAWSAA